MESQQWLNAILEEYKSLRTESLTSMQNQQTTLRFGTSAIGVSLALAFNVQDFNARLVVFIGLIPALSLVFFLLYAIEFGRMVRVGRYIEAIERKINAKFEGSEKPLGWEQWLELRVDKRNPRLPFYYAVPAMFLAAAIFSNIVAFLFCYYGQICYLIYIPIIIFSAASCIVVITYISLRLKSLRKSYDIFFHT